MDDTNTTNLGLTKPEDGASVGNWGLKLNTNFDILDASPGISVVAGDAEKTALGTTWEGRVVYQADTDRLYKYNGSAWVDVSPRTRGIAFYIGGVLAANLVASFVAPCALTAIKVLSSVGTAPTGTAIVLDVLKNGISMFTTQANRPTIDAAATSDESVAPDVTSILAGDRITLKVISVGSTVAGAELGATLVCEGD